MTCESITDHLAFLLNGSLADVERAEVLEHLRGCDGCRQVLREVAFVWIASDAHPPAEYLVDYAHGDHLEAFPRDLLEQHLATCDGCAQAVVAAGPPPLDLLPMPTPEALPAAKPPSRLDETKRWRSFAIAASLLTATLASLLFWVEVRPEAPIANLAIVELFPADERVRGTGDRTGTISRTDATALVLVPSSTTSGRAFRVVIATEAGRKVDTIDGLQRSPNGDFILLLPTSSLPAGTLVLRLETEQAAVWSLIGEYRIEVAN